MRVSASVNEPRRSSLFRQFDLLVHYPNFGLLWSGQVVSHLGDAFYSIALIWLVQELTGSRALMGAVSATISAMALFGLVAGVFVDRWDRRLTMLFSDILRASIILILPILWMTGGMQLWQIFVVAAAMGLIGQFFYPAKQALLPNLVSSADLTAANALSQMAMTLLLATGYALGGVMLGYMTAIELFVFDAVTFAVSAVTIFFIRTPNSRSSQIASQTPRAGQGLAQLKNDIVVGLRYIREDALILTIIPVSLLANFIFAPITVLTAAWAKDVINAGATGFGLLEGSFLVGSLLGTLAVSSLTERFRRSSLVMWGLVLMGLPLVIFALIPNLYLNTAMLAIIGFVNGIVNITVITAIQQRVPDELMGRVFGALTGMVMLLAPVGVALGGVIADIMPLSYIFSFIGLAMVLIGASLFRRPAMVELD